MKYKIYKLQNKINGKIYIGKTKRSIVARMKDHRNSKCCIYLYNALKKYGEDGFDINIIYETDNEDDICRKEKEYILQYNSLVPNGYNLVLDTDQGRTFHSSTKQLMSNNTQGGCKTVKIWSKYIGVRSRKNSKLYSVRVTKNQKTYFHYYTNELDAAKAYDKVVLYLYGLNAKLNFPEKFEIYKTINLKEFFCEFCKKHTKTSKYIGVSKMSYYENSPWRAYVYKDKKQINLGIYKTEKEAYDARKKYNDKIK
jgi:hypothetical protein